MTALRTVSAAPRQPGDLAGLVTQCLAEPVVRELLVGVVRALSQCLAERPGADITSGNSRACEEAGNWSRGLPEDFMTAYWGGRLATPPRLCTDLQLFILHAWWASTYADDPRRRIGEAKFHSAARRWAAAQSSPLVLRKRIRLLHEDGEREWAYCWLPLGATPLSDVPLNRWAAQQAQVFNLILASNSMVFDAAKAQRENFDSGSAERARLLVAEALNENFARPRPAI